MSEHRTPYIVTADRSFSNESAGRGMWGALVRGGTVLCYFPDRRAAMDVAILLGVTLPQGNTDNARSVSDRIRLDTV